MDQLPSTDPPQNAQLVVVEPGEIVLRAEPMDHAPAIEYLTPQPRRSIWQIPLLIVTSGAILLLIAAMIVPRFKAGPGLSRISVAKTDIATFEIALDAFEIDNGRYPTQAEGLQALLTPPRGAVNWHGPYQKQVPSDPWGMPYIYQFPSKHNGTGVDLSSYGPDKKPSSDDIKNWSGP